VWGGWTLGKARYLRDIMADYGVDKPVIANELALGCPSSYPWCYPVPTEFREAQADFVVRTFARDLSEDIRIFIWYSLDGPGWRETGLLWANKDSRPAFRAYRQLATRLNGSQFEQAVDYGPEVEAYEFVTAAKRVHVLWSIDAVDDTVRVPQDGFLNAYDLEGYTLPLVPDGDDYVFTAGFSPIYFVMTR
jgi:hypothetical protein